MSWDPNYAEDQGFSQPPADNGGFDGAAEPRSRRPEGGNAAHEDRFRTFNWASNRSRYEYNENAVGEDGLALRDEKLEQELFEVDAAEQQTTLDFSRYESIPIRVQRGEAPPPIKSFDEADLHPVMKDNVRLAKYAKPTPVQTYSIPIVTSGKDLMACAQTGSGKTAAFLIPTLSALFGSAKELAKPRPAPYEYRSYRAEPLVLILAPTRELCSQIFDECRRFTYRSMLRPCAVYGGADAISQIRQLERGCDILAAAPGRLMDFIERGKIGLNRVKYLVLDEADRMLDMGFEAIIRALVLKKGMNPDRQTLMYSATFPRAIRALARDFLKPDYLFLKVGRVGGTTNSITQKVMYVNEEDKRESLRALLNSQPPSRTLIFVETKRSADSLDQYLFDRSFPSTSIHGDRTQMEREDALLGFKSGQTPILVATAVAARGIDIRNVMHVVNYDMPNDMDEYIHRIGRTARVGKSGLATSFYNERSMNLAPELTKLLKENKQEIPDFLQEFVTDDNTWDEDLDDDNVEAPSYAGQEYVAPAREVPGRGPPGGAPAGGEFGAGDFGASGGAGGWDAGAAANGWDAGAAGGSNDWNAGGGGDYGADSGYGATDYGNSGGYNERPKRDGDWDCPSCSVSNFAKRTECFKCGTGRPEGAGGFGGGQSRPGEWICPDCGINNFSRRTTCFKCDAARPEGMGEPARGPPPRRDGDWDCSCGAVNFARRTDCYKCHALKDGGDSGYGGGYDQPSYDAGETSNFGASGGDWNADAAAAGWGGAAATETPAAPADGGWGASNDTPAAAPAAGGWDNGASAAPAAPSTGGWGASNDTTSAPAASGWGEPAQPAAPAAGGWGASNDTPAAPAAGGWGEPAQPAAPAPSSGGWGASNDTPAAAPAAGGWGEPAQPVAPAQPAAPAPSSGGWGAPAAAPAPAPAQPAAQDNGWGAAPAVADGGWGAAPTASNGMGW
ncbi:uncharacterized protein BYT42DRAFT_638460 [Radiomyces spectabilis]|uniref:uncharacterized protein n=1 Tax=Radiomyces spectabilis TaxID=64574 RepID=UPI002220B7F3|nr:uncharacterized protein BYT42DRAFT_638460 [Radiomyces spectabilis]KAI8376277.1 hypothetical protein BYT42DRAFT_638460 [Radiomyces spectabilis]